VCISRCWLHCLTSTIQVVLHVAARIRPYPQLAEQARVGRAGEAQGQQHQLARDFAVGAGYIRPLSCVNLQLKIKYQS